MSNESILKLLDVTPDDDTRRDLMELLYTQNIKLIQKAIKPYIGAGMEAEDGLQEGYIALCQAVEHFQKDSGATFSTYLVTQIRATVGRAFKDTNHIKRLPSYLQDRIYRYNRVRAEYMTEAGEEPTDRYLQQQLKLSAEQLDSLRRAMYTASTVSLSQPIGQDPEDGGTLEDIIPDEADAIGAAFDRLSAEQDAAELWAAVDSLEDSQADTIRSRYQGGRTLAETGHALGISVEQVRQRETKALHRLRRMKEVKRIGADRGYTSMVYAGGLSRFKNTQVSIVEYIALRRMGCDLSSAER